MQKPDAREECASLAETEVPLHLRRDLTTDSGKYNAYDDGSTGMNSQRICTECRTVWLKGRGRCQVCGSFEWSHYVPTKEQILAECARIQAGWNRYQEAEHCAAGRVPWVVGLAHVNGGHNGRIMQMTVREA